MLRFILALLVFVPLTIQAQTISNRSSLSIEQIMQGADFVGHLPSNIRWSADSKSIYFSWNPDKDTLSTTYKVSVDNNDIEKVSDEELKMLPRSYTFNSDRTMALFSRNGDIYLQKSSTNTITQVTNTIDSEYSLSFSGDEKDILFVQKNNLFAWNIESGALRQLTNFKSGSPKSEPKLAENEEWLQRDQLEYFDILSQRKAESELRKKRSEALQAKRPLEYHLKGRSLSNIQASPHLNYITFRLTKSAKSKNTKVPSYVSESGYIRDLRSRPKVGSAQSSSQFGIYDVANDTIFLLDTKQIEGIYDKPAYLEEYHKGDSPYTSTFEKPRKVIVHGPIYSEDNQAIVVIRSQDNKDRWISSLDLTNGKLKLLDRQHDEAWIGGPGISNWNFSSGNVGWLSDNEHIWFQSEATGYSHLYTLNVKTGEKKALTQGQFEILDAELSQDKKFFYITANAEGPGEQHFYRLAVSGGELEKITSITGNHQVVLSPDEKQLAIRYSYSNKPWELYLMPNEKGEKMKQITQSTTEAFNSYSWRDPEIVKFIGRDGVEVPARLYRPQKPKRNGPAVIFVHGAGYLQNVHNWWSSYYREYMFHNMLADNGYTVLDIDYRASSGYGRDWRTGIYRHMGGKDLEDQIDGAKFLAQNYQVSPERIGIYGGSYGGFITLMALFTSPGTFKCGAALRSVTDWAHYNHGYTSNILNTPVLDSVAYYRSSPIYHAEGLEDNLLILHGMIDTNVQFQDVVRLAQRLIELGKDNWEFAVFPLEGHGFIEASSWTDEYKRIYQLFEEQLK